MKKQTTTFGEAALVIAIVAALMSVFIIRLGSPPQVPMLLGCAVACAVALHHGYSWDEIQEGMIEGITQALGSIIIILLIGVLIGVWIGAGVVPAMIYYGLKLLSPRFFLVSCMALCAVVSLPLGSWGTAGTLGIAMIGIAQILGIPTPLAAGAVISGCYVGDKVSPISDTANLVSAVTGVDVFENVRSSFLPTSICFVLSGMLYTALGFRYAGSGGSEQVEALGGQLKELFSIGFYDFLPVAILAICILCRIPSVPSIFFGAFSAAILGALVQHQNFSEIASSVYYGYLCHSGNETIDSLLSAGGIESMLYSLALVLIAMMFGGVMETAGLTHAFMLPLTCRIRRYSLLIASTVVASMLTNAIMADQYVGIALPGKMFSSTYEERHIPKTELTRALAAGGSSFSPMVPWNTCGVFMSTVLGVSTYQYFSFTYLNLLIPLVTVLLAVLQGNRARRHCPC